MVSRLITGLFFFIAATGLQAGTMSLVVEPTPAPGLPEHLQITGQTDLERRLDEVNAALEERPDMPVLLHRRGSILYQLGRGDAARSDWRTAAAQDPVLPPAEVMADVQEVFRLQMLSGDEAARAQLDLAAERHAENPWFHLLRAEQAMRSRAFGEAETAYLRALELDPELFVTHLNLGRFYEFVGDQSKARAHYVSATESGPDHRLTWDFLGEHQFAGGAPDAAFESFLRAEEADPEQPPAELRMARLAATTGDQIAARHWSLAALDRRDAPRYEALVGLSDAQMRLGLLEEARQTLDAAIVERRTAPVLMARGYVAEELGDVDGAIRLYRDAISADPGNVIAANNLAMALLRADGNLDEARVHATYAYEQLPQNGTILGTYAAVEGLSGGGAEVRDLVERAVRVAPDDPWLRFALGRHLIGEGASDAARLHLEAALILDPDFPRRGEIEALLGTQ
jgi:tetratricopeptide (TPR) repeat protein